MGLKEMKEEKEFWEKKREAKRYRSKDKETSLRPGMSGTLRKHGDCYWFDYNTFY